MVLLTVLEVDTDDTAGTELDDDSTGATEAATELDEATITSVGADDVITFAIIFEDEARTDVAATELVERAAGFSA